MTETEQLHQDFLNDFTELLRRYNAEFEICDNNAEIFFYGDEIRSYSYINLPYYIKPN